ncbi:MAG: CDP-alcohol phosphatidyltransferase family protein [Ruminococcus flavefaciens]|nr:CDP-alcohol phosphatidyltransferase family protein [Ruminococcus flavefaciens]MCM1228740.1 CDP-alcohol phosphatidyltransferase family protein [Ruminococcus flavefaciens]
MIGFYNYTVILTYISLASAITGIFLSCGMCGNTPHPTYAIVCLMISGLCDMFDGKVARTKKDRTDDEKKFGIQIDSLCDAVCFGILPTVIGYSVGLNTFADLPVLILFPLCAVIRLAYFNVTEESRQKKTEETRKVYEGLPVTSVSLILPLIYSFQRDIGEYFPQVYGTAMLLIAIAFITRFKVKKPGMKTMLSFIGIGILEFLWLMYKKNK